MVFFLVVVANGCSMSNITRNEIFLNIGADVLCLVSVFVSINPSVVLCLYISVRLCFDVCLLTFASACSSLCRVMVSLCICPSVYQSQVCLSVYLSVWKSFKSLSYYDRSTSLMRGRKWLILLITKCRIKFDYVFNVFCIFEHFSEIYDNNIR